MLTVLLFIQLIRRQCFERNRLNLGKASSSCGTKPPAAVIMASFQRPNNHSHMTGVSRKIRHLRHEDGSEKSVSAVLDFPEARLSSFSMINSGLRKQ